MQFLSWRQVPLDYYSAARAAFRTPKQRRRKEARSNSRVQIYLAKQQ
jgi:hypothetical protein